MPKRPQKRGGKAHKYPPPWADSPPSSDDFTGENFWALLAWVTQLEEEKAERLAGVGDGDETSCATSPPCHSTRVGRGNRMHLSLPSRLASGDVLGEEVPTAVPDVAPPVGTAMPALPLAPSGAGEAPVLAAASCTAGWGYRSGSKKEGGGQLGGSSKGAKID